MPRRRRIHVAVLAYEGCMSSAVVGLLDAFHIANRLIAWTAADGPRFTTSVLGRSRAVRGSAGFALSTQPLTQKRRIDVAIVPPMLMDVEKTLATNADLVAWLQRYAMAQTAIAASVCAGAFFLAEAGILHGRRITTNPAFAPMFARQHPDTTLLLERRILADGRVLTAGTTTAFLDLAIHLVDRFAGHAIAAATAKALNIDKNPASQLPYFLPFADKNHGDNAIVQLQQWLEERFVDGVSSHQMARRAAMSQRTLNRRFLAATGLSPISYLHRLRIEAAKRMLETSDANVQEITTQVGYADARSFTRLFRTHVGLSPRGYRGRFGMERAGR